MNASVSEIEGLPALVVLSGGWRPDYADAMRDERLTALSIRVGEEDGLEFLREVPDLRGLVLNAGDIRDLAPIEELRQLETLTLNTPKRPRLNLDFGAFPNLRSLAMYWNRGFESVFGCRTLERLFVFDPPDTDLDRFADIDSLARLELSEGRKLNETAGIERFPDLKFFGLYFQAGLQALTGLSHAVTLEELAIESCKKLMAIDEVSGLTRLRRLKLADCGAIASLKPLAKLSDLDSFLAWESTNVADGDLSVLLRLPNLRDVALMSRRHYQPSVKEVEDLLAERAQRS